MPVYKVEQTVKGDLIKQQALADAWARLAAIASQNKCISEADPSGAEHTMKSSQAAQRQQKGPELYTLLQLHLFK